MVGKVCMFASEVILICIVRYKKDKSEFAVHYVKDGPKVDTNECDDTEPTVSAEYAVGMVQHCI